MDYLYLLATVVTGMAFVVAAYVRAWATPLVFTAPYTPAFGDALLMVAGAMIPKMLMRVYEHRTAASRLMHLQLHVTAAMLFFFAMILLFYFQPGTRIPISIVLIFIAVDLAAAVILMPELPSPRSNSAGASASCGVSGSTKRRLVGAAIGSFNK